MKVFRVEHRFSGYGPYCTNRGYDTLARKVADAHSGPNTRQTHPTTANDGFWQMMDPLDHWGNFRHGLKRLKDAREWFAGFADDLAEAGFVVRTYLAPRGTFYVGFSGRQVMFDIHRAQRVYTREIWRE